MSTKKDSRWEGMVSAFHRARGLHRIHYDDGAVEVADLRKMRFDVLSGGVTY